MRTSRRRWDTYAFDFSSSGGHAVCPWLASVTMMWPCCTWRVLPKVNQRDRWHCFWTHQRCPHAGMTTMGSPETAHLGLVIGGPARCPLRGPPCPTWPWTDVSACVLGVSRAPGQSPFRTRPDAASALRAFPVGLSVVSGIKTPSSCCFRRRSGRPTTSSGYDPTTISERLHRAPRTDGADPTPYLSSNGPAPPSVP